MTDRQAITSCMYTIFKVKVTENNSNRAVARRYQVDEKSVRDQAVRHKMVIFERDRHACSPRPLGKWAGFGISIKCSRIMKEYSCQS